MGADNSKAQRFWEFHHDGKAISVVLWHSFMGEDQGYYCGYVGWTDPNREFPADLDFHYGDAAGGMNTSEIPEIGISVHVTGFDTMHAHDVNIGPDGSMGWAPKYSYGSEPTVWTKNKVFKRLRDVTDDALDYDLEPLF